MVGSFLEKRLIQIAKGRRPASDIAGSILFTFRDQTVYADYQAGVGEAIVRTIYEMRLTRPQN